MFYTGLPTGGTNEIPQNLQPLEELCTECEAFRTYTDSLRGTNSHEQLKMMLLPFTANNRQVHIAIKSTSTTIAMTKNILNDAEPASDNVEIHILVTGLNLTLASNLELLNQNHFLPERICKALDVAGTNPPIVLMNGNRIVVLTSKHVALMTSNLVALLPHLRPDLLKDVPYPVPLELFNYLGTGKYSLWERTLLKWATPLAQEIITQKRENAMTHFFSTAKTSILEGFGREYDAYNEQRLNLEQELNRIYDNIAQQLARIRDYTLHGRDMTPTIDYWKKKKELTKITLVAPGIAELRIRTPVTNYDLDELLQYLSSSRQNDFNSTLKAINFYTRLFVERTHTLWFSMNIRFDIKSNNIDKSDNEEGLYDYAIPNEHIYRYNCWGNNRRLIIDAMKKQEYEVAIEQTIASIACLNFSDPAVIQSLWSRLDSSSMSMNAKAIERNDTKERITIKQFLKECES